MKLTYNKLIQQIADKLEADSGAIFPELDLTVVLRAVESLENDGYALEYIAQHEKLVAQRMNRLASKELIKVAK